MKKKTLIHILVCLIFFSGFTINIFAKDQNEAKSVIDLANYVFKGVSDLGQWRYTSSMVIPRCEYPAVICGDYIYALGGHYGYTLAPYSTVERAKINSDGTLGKWVLEADTLPIPVYGSAAISKNGYIYVISGDVIYAHATPAVQYTKANPDGTLQPWQQTSPLQQTRVNLAAVEYNGYIYVMGGNPDPPMSESKPLGVNSVEYAKINPDGTLGNWSYTSSNQLGRWQPSAHAYNGYIYLLGGIGPDGETVEYAQINPDGSLSVWSYTSPMTVERAGSPGTAVVNGYLYAIAGHGYSSEAPVNTVEKAQINMDGSLGTWSLEAETLMCRVAHMGRAQNNGHIYLAGGQDGTSPYSSMDDVQMSGVYYLIGGDANCDGKVTVSDVVYLINYLFKGGPPPGC